LGDDNATNSIGKSTLLMIVDFALGGNSLLSHNTDLVAELGHHDYFFTFQFGDHRYCFRRGTSEPSVVYVCDETSAPVRGMRVEEYTATLKQAYNITVPDLSFRALVGLYLRVWGKENLSVEHPLNAARAQRLRECVDTLIKTFERYDSIRDLTVQLNAVESEFKAFTAAVRHEIIPIVTKKTYARNQSRISELEDSISDIRANLARYATNLSEIVSKEVLQLKLDKDQLIGSRLEVANRVERVRRNISENRHISSRSFRDLINFFPEVNQERLVQVEEFHSGVARLLRTELKQSEAHLEQQLAEIDAAIRHIDVQMAHTLSSVDEPAHLVDSVLDVAVALRDALRENQRFEQENELRGSLKRLRSELVSWKDKVLSDVEGLVNDGMRGIVTSVFGEERKSPRIALRDGSYSFDVYEDTGTGTAYIGLVIFDLTVFLLTQLPFVAHDSVLFKNIENNSVAKLLQVYMRTEKQSFIAIDEIEKYGKDAASVLREHSVIQLDDRNVLYVKDWRK